ncbi:MAG: hypothetical protein H6625_12295 [Bdellovibrionaceae bacterium]|nr:hypothetical protein [Pseudobdellovibrionaceae bacterium]
MYNLVIKNCIIISIGFSSTISFAKECSWQNELRKNFRKSSILQLDAYKTIRGIYPRIFESCGKKICTGLVTCTKFKRNYSPPYDTIATCDALPTGECPSATFCASGEIAAFKTAKFYLMLDEASKVLQKNTPPPKGKKVD